MVSIRDFVGKTPMLRVVIIHIIVQTVMIMVNICNSFS